MENGCEESGQKIRDQLGSNSNNVREKSWELDLGERSRGGKKYLNSKHYWEIASERVIN